VICDLIANCALHSAPLQKNYKKINNKPPEYVTHPF